MIKKVKRTFFFILLIVIAIVGYYTYSIIKFGNSIHKNPATTITVKDGKKIEQTPPEWEGKERVNILLLGGDGRTEKEPGRSDSIMVASIDPVTKQANIYSILRDTYTAIPEHGKRKINEAYTYGGPMLAMKTVSDFTGIPIHYYFFIDFESFVKLVDAIGGIEFEVEKNMYYVDKTPNQEYVINLKKGLQHLDGNKALQYVRFRYDATSDYTRTERQREFLKAVIDKVKSMSTLVSLPKILDELAPYIETNMDVGAMLKLAMLGLKIEMSNIQTGQLPPMDLLREDFVNGQSVILVDEDRLKSFVQDELTRSAFPLEVKPEPIP